MEKQCLKCKEFKLLKEFHKDKSKKDGFRNQCKKCSNKYRKTWYGENINDARLKGNISSKRWYRENLHKVKGEKLKTYWPNCSGEEAIILYERLLKQQNHVCAICKNTESVIDKRSGRIRSLAVDHNHKTGAVRGLLCKRCNIGIGIFNSDFGTELLSSAFTYINEK